ncbi:MAG: FGGY-family carbohydrate kinase, partial [Staphylococcus epidermidis]|nr:FGGY-family carbohydrate kinase [Staphylococcus epidermidis]
YEMIHRAYIEATAFGTKLIMKQFEDNHIPVHTVYASGGIPQKSKLLVEIYANVLNKRVVVIDSSNASALGAAMLGANVGNAYSTLKEAALSMKQPIAYIQEPEIQKVQAYKPLYHKYCELHDLLGRQYPELSYLI